MDIKLIDTLRASREGHHFHEAWAARLALTLLVPKGGLIGIAVERLSPVDQAGDDDATAKIADCESTAAIFNISIILNYL
ncbi:hypothetical protein [Pseudomonas sp. Marseille-Q1929]|uniref:hypothetical protein n=1 Tax=Pseudomonas sp. Marseille-Q1929 TaxID=2730402 RepID=UPI001A8E7C11|nr:hypothetical protein [Pseudomonas sp. Marseille-Q1929]MBO0495411.1 hypothetical protein [Pseudomonas sp. Marseille-Q1929]